MLNIQYGKVMYSVYTRDELDQMGLVVNPYMYIGDGWRFCVVCMRYAYVYAMSHKGMADCFEVCRDCETHVRGANDPVPDLVYANYIKNFPTSDPRD